MGFPFDSAETIQLNKDIFETIYFASLNAYMSISKKREELLKRYKTLLQENEKKLSEIYQNQTIINEDIIELQKLYNTYKPIDEELNRDDFLDSYFSFNGSSASQGILQYYLWKLFPKKCS